MRAWEGCIFPCMYDMYDDMYDCTSTCRIQRSKILPDRLRVLSLAVGFGVNREERKVNATYRSSALLRYPGWDQTSKSSATLMQGVTIQSRCSLGSILADVPGALKRPDPGSEDPGKLIG